MPYSHPERYTNNKFVASAITPAFRMFLENPSAPTLPEGVGATDFTEILKAFFSPAWGIIVNSGAAATAIPNATYGPVEIPYDMTLTAAEIVATPITGQSNGNITFDIYVDTYGNWPPTVGDSIIGAGVKPALSSALKMQDSDLSDWTDLTLAKGSKALFVVSGCTNIAVAALKLTNTRTA